MPLLLSKRRSMQHLTPAKPPDSSSRHHHDTASLRPKSASNLAPADPNIDHRPVSEHGPSSRSISRLSHELHPDDIPDDPPNHHHAAPQPKRFSLMNLRRNFSESHLAARARMDDQPIQEELPPIPAVTAEGVVPTIVKTAPTMDHAADAPAQHVEVEEQRTPRPGLFKRGSSRGRVSPHKDPRKSSDEKRAEKKSSTSLRWRRGKNSGLEDLHRMSTYHIQNQSNQNQSAPPSYGDESNSALAVPVGQLADPRFSESSRSDGSNGSSGDGHIYGSTTTTTHTVSTHTTFFRLPRRNKNRNSLFPLPVKLPPPEQSQQQAQQSPATPRASTQSNRPEEQGTPTNEQGPQGTLQRRHTATSPVKFRGHSQSAPSPNAALAKSSLSFAEPGMNLFRASSERSLNSCTSSPLQPPMRRGTRGRSSTNSSWRSSHDVETPPALSASGRNSTSTTGRSSFGGFLTLSRFRQGSEPHSPRHGSPGTNSKSNSFAISREALVIPEREEGDTPGKYLERLESAVSRSVIAGILSKSGDSFAIAVLRSYTRRFAFFGEPIDMSLRKFLLEAELPKETQQVDRVIQAFADRYHECNPGVFLNSDQAYVIAFSIMMLHTDAFNKNNKHKMQKQDYIKNTSGQGLSDDILSCFFDNICYTPFIHFDEDVDINGQKVLPFKPKKSGHKLKTAIPGADVVTKKPSGPLDPYNLLVESKLDTLRPALKDTILLDDPYDYRGSQGDLDAQYLNRAFTHTGILQIVSARSRPAAYESQFANGNPTAMETQQGIVDLKITKVGTLWRKSARKKKARSPWQEWGAILTGSQLYLFKNSHWAKGLMHQFMQHQRPGQPRTPVVFKPPLQDFKPDALIKTDNAVALVDSTYTRHKNAFTFVRPGGQEEVLLADNEHELTDWLGLINYAAAFRAAGVRIRGMVGGNEEDLRNKDVRRLESTASTRSIQTQTGEITIQNRGLTPQLQRQVMAARRQIMVHKIAEIEKDITDANRQLENMLRNARHLLVLAPLAQKTREDVIHAAARADAMIKWLRRDIWRMKCHRDILAMDVRLDGLSASDLEKLAQEQATPNEPESAKKEKPKVLSRLSSSKANIVKSPPQSPTIFQTPGRPSTGDTFKGNDVFRTPPESVTPQREDPFRLPPLSLDTSAQNEHRPSVTSTLLSASPRVGGGSLTHSSSASSILQVQRTHSSLQPDSTVQRPDTASEPAVDERELRLLATATMGPAQTEMTPRAIEGPAGPAANRSPESKHKGVRRSLQKTLREAHGHHHHSTHKHRRNKDSDSTVRSGGFDDRDLDDATPGLQREKPRFILHGKQASVVQFGGDWERMKLRREQYGQQHPSSPSQEQRDAAYERRRSEQHELLRAGMTSPVVQEFQRHGSITEDDDDIASVVSEGTRSFREDAEAAAAYSSAAEGGPSASPMRMSSGDDDGVTTDSEYFDLSTWDPDQGRRTTIIGPSSEPILQNASAKNMLRHRRYSSLEKGEDGNVEIVDHDDSDDDEAHSPTSSKSKRRSKAKRQTVIGPTTQVEISTDGLWNGVSENGKGKGRENIAASSSAEASTSHREIHSRGSASAGAASSSADVDVDDVEEDERGFVNPISDEELRLMSASLRAVKTR
ncbi:hypothetical protein M409DRAFT_50511 [Zasmidium cellare ATCC 36951]|uniref:SEC7 domain-containing protein n=1 Tax=Zasmidium cellare ATCC 36951 TaxID=1080233 RepID=A0A6A6CXX4_ZASCE|nr:uncharacterized protein M409DRAFT_50511 [Zasmidium cellare ATCC 36951]KAF2171895.1 hypothetical protein M409DRAFT_50511 [Zasmidium cellare ATCC 36951]